MDNTLGDMFSSKNSLNEDLFAIINGSYTNNLKQYI